MLDREKQIMNEIISLEDLILGEGSKLDRLAWEVVKKAYQSSNPLDPTDNRCWHYIEKVIPAYKRVRKALSGDFIVHPDEV